MPVNVKPAATTEILPPLPVVPGTETFVAPAVAKLIVPSPKLTVKLPPFPPFPPPVAEKLMLPAPVPSCNALVVLNISKLTLPPFPVLDVKDGPLAVTEATVDPDSVSELGVNDTDPAFSFLFDKALAETVNVGELIVTEPGEKSRFVLLVLPAPFVVSVVDVVLEKVAAVGRN